MKKSNGFLLPEMITGYELDCVVLKIPRNFEYRSAFTGHILQLTRWWMWEKDGTTRASQAARYWHDLLLSHLIIGEDCGGNMPSYTLAFNGCDLELRADGAPVSTVTLDGEACPSLVGAPGANGLNGEDGADGEDGMDGADGADGAGAISNLPSAPAQGTDAACNAASYVSLQVYVKVIQMAQSAGSVFDFLGIATLSGLVFDFQRLLEFGNLWFTSSPDQLEITMALHAFTAGLYCSNFDVESALQVVANEGFSPLTLTIWQAAARAVPQSQYAIWIAVGAIDSSHNGQCEGLCPDNSWCIEFPPSFELWTPNVPNQGILCGNKWCHSDYNKSGTTGDYRTVQIGIRFDANVSLTRMEMDYDRIAGSFSPNTTAVSMHGGGVALVLIDSANAPSGTGLNLVWAGERQSDFWQVGIRSSRQVFQGSITLHRVRMWGTGARPTIGGQLVGQLCQ